MAARATQIIRYKMTRKDKNAKYVLTNGMSQICYITNGTKINAMRTYRKALPIKKGA